MKRSVNVLGKMKWGKGACAVLVQCAAAAAALSAQTLTTLYRAITYLPNRAKPAMCSVSQVIYCPVQLR
jgi:hypothetical protein